MTIISLHDSDNPRQEAKVSQALNSWADQGTLDPDRSAALAGIIRRRARRERVSRGITKGLAGLLATAACSAVLVAASPAVRTWAADNLPVVGQYLQRWYPSEKGWEWAEQHQMFQDVLAMRTDQGYTFRVHRVLADPTQTTVIFTVEGPELADSSGLVRLDPEHTKLGSRSFLSSWSSRSEILDGVRVGSIKLGPLPAQSGRLILAVRGLADLSGNWDVSFDVTRVPLDDLSRAIELEQSLPIPGGTVTLRVITLTPLNTVVVLEYLGQSPAPQFGTGWPVTLTTEAGLTLEGHGGGAGSHTDGDGWVTAEYTLEFDPLQAGVDHITLAFGGYQFVLTGEELSLPLDGRVVTLAGGWQVRVTDLWTSDGSGRATLDYSNEESAHRQLLVEWAVLDDAGEVHLTRRAGDPNPQPLPTEQPGDDSRAETVTWALPQGRTAVSLLAKGYRIPAADIGTMTVVLPAIDW